MDRTTREQMTLLADAAAWVSKLARNGADAAPPEAFLAWIAADPGHAEAYQRFAPDPMLGACLPLADGRDVLASDTAEIDNDAAPHGDVGAPGAAPSPASAEPDAARVAQAQGWLQCLVADGPSAAYYRGLRAWLAADPRNGEAFVAMTARATDAGD